MGAGLIFLLISILCRKGKIKNRQVLRGLPFVLMYLYGIIQMAFFGLNVQAKSGGVNSYVIAVILISFCLIVKPIQNIIPCT